jgi:hypothetical protein
MLPNATTRRHLPKLILLLEQSTANQDLNMQLLRAMWNISRVTDFDHIILLTHLQSQHVGVVIYATGVVSSLRTSQSNIASQLVTNLTRFHDKILQRVTLRALIVAQCDLDMRLVHVLMGFIRNKMHISKASRCLVRLCMQDKNLVLQPAEILEAFRVEPDPHLLFLIGMTSQINLNLVQDLVNLLLYTDHKYAAALALTLSANRVQFSDEVLYELSRLVDLSNGALLTNVGLFILLHLGPSNLKRLVALGACELIQECLYVRETQKLATQVISLIKSDCC